MHDKHNLASPSPVTDGQMVYAWFGTGQLVALDMNGKMIWQRHLGQEISPFDVIWGHSSSPTLFGDLLILLCDHEPASYLLAVDKRTGKERWRADRGKGRMSYSTPLVVNTPSGPELIVNSSERVDAYDPRTGTLLWFTGGTNRFPIPMPVFHDGLIYMSRGYRSGPYMAIRPGGRGDVSKSHVVWESATGAPYISSLVYDAGLIYMATDVGAITRRGREDRAACLAAARRRDLFRFAGCRRRKDLFRQRDRRDDRDAVGAHADGAVEERSRGAGSGVARDLQRADFHSDRRSCVLHRDRRTDVVRVRREGPSGPVEPRNT